MLNNRSVTQSGLILQVRNDFTVVDSGLQIAALPVAATSGLFSVDGFRSAQVNFGSTAPVSANGQYLSTDGLFNTFQIEVSRAPFGQVFFGTNLGAFGDVRSRHVFDYKFEVTAIPEPFTIAVLGVGVVGVVARRRKKKRA